MFLQGLTTSGTTDGKTEEELNFTKSKVIRRKFIMNRLIVLILVTLFSFGFSVTSMAQEVPIMVKGLVWDSDSWGFAFYQNLSKQQALQKAARRGARVSVDGHPDVFAITGEGGKFEFTLTTSQPTFRLIVEGDRFPRTITQPFTVPEGGGEFDVGEVNTPRAEGIEHTWPLPMVANALGYTSTHEMLADNKAAIRMYTYGSGAEGAPELTNNAKITFPNTGSSASTVEPTSTSPFLMRVPQSEYLVPFDMNTRDTFFQLTGPTLGAYIIIVSFAPDEGTDKDIVIQIEDTITDELLDPPRPWKFSPRTVSVRKGFATEFYTAPDF